MTVRTYDWKLVYRLIKFARNFARAGVSREKPVWM